MATKWGAIDWLPDRGSPDRGVLYWLLDGGAPDWHQGEVPDWLSDECPRLIPLLGTPDLHPDESPQIGT